MRNLPPRPKEITPEEWELWTSPENYYMDGEVSPREADAIFMRRLRSTVKQRRQRARYAAEAPARKVTARCCANGKNGARCTRAVTPPDLVCWQHDTRTHRR